MQGRLGGKNPIAARAVISYKTRRMKIMFAVLVATVLPWVSSLRAGQSDNSSERLRKDLEELNVLLERYTELHPAVIAKRQQIAELQKGLSAASVKESQSLQSAREELKRLLEKYTDRRPAVVEQRQRISLLEERQKVVTRTATALQKALAELNVLLQT